MLVLGNGLHRIALPPVTSAANVRPLNIAFLSMVEHSTPLPQSQSGRLRFHDHIESDDGATGDEHPSYIPYIIEWRVTLNNRVLAKDTEQDLDSTPSSY